MTTFRVLHVSDLHTAHRPKLVSVLDVRHGSVRDVINLSVASSYSKDLLDALESFLATRQDLDAVVITGDLATTGLADDLAVATAFVQRIRAQGHRVVVIPGNHDRFDGPLCAPGGTKFEQSFVEWKGRQQRVSGPYVLEQDAKFLAIVAADLSLPAGYPNLGTLGRFGQGVATGAAVSELEQLTTQLRNEYAPLAVVWAVHFPARFPGISDQLRLLKDDDLLSAAKRSGITAVLSGHTHLPAIYFSGVPVLCAGSATQHICPDGNFVHDTAFHLLADGSVEVARTDFRWDDSRMDWAPVGANSFALTPAMLTVPP